MLTGSCRWQITRAVAFTDSCRHVNMCGLALNSAAGGTLPYAEFVDNNLVPPKVLCQLQEEDNASTRIVAC